MFPDSDIAAKYSRARIKTTAIIKYVFADESRQDLIQYAQTEKFGFSADGGSDETENLFPLCIRH